MPTLHWIGKDKVENHHLDVPVRSLDTVYTEGAAVSQNKIIHGDNLEALKALLPQYEGKIKCIYIDPPYNTGNEGWVYNDNVNDPKIKKWLGQVVGKESEDLSRHDKWLCMMYPRLQLLKKLLAEDGAIFISIDDNEQAHLKLVCDEVFGINKFICQLIWKSRQNKDNRNINRVSNDHEYILCYGSALKGLQRNNSNYSNPDNDSRGAWTSANMVGLLDEKQRPNLHFDLIDPNTNINYGKAKMGWRYDRNTMKKLIEENRIIWPSSEEGRPRRKVFLADLQTDVTGLSSIVGENIFTRNGTKAIQDIFEERSFDFAKPSELIQELINQSTNPNDLILDSFAGSGTTAHAVLNLNKQDGGNRRFILIEMEDYAERITAERVRRVIKGYGTTAGTGGDFAYCTLGERLFDADKNINPDANIAALRAYVFYSETKTALNVGEVSNGADVNKTTEETPSVSPYFLGAHDGVGYYFYYERDQATTLGFDFLAQLSPTDAFTERVIYADNCLLSDIFLQENRLIFKKIPRDIVQI